MSLRLVRSNGNVVKRRRPKKAEPDLHTTKEIVRIAGKLDDLRLQNPEAVVAIEVLVDSYLADYQERPTG